MISNTHWDREWYMTNEQYMARLVPMIDRLLDTMERYPLYQFVLDGQYRVLQDYLMARPEMKERVHRLACEGRLHVGPWYTQPLETIASGEGLIRNLQHGISGAEQYGPAMMCSYEIDEFGHASQIPQILKGFGIDSAVAWRGIPIGTKSAFIWEGADGSRVWMLYSNDGYGEATTLPEQEEDFDEIIDGKVYRRRGLKNRISALRKFREPHADTVHLMWLNGIDHSFAQENLVEVLKKAEAIDPELDFCQSSPQALAADIQKDYEERHLSLSTLKGELMWEGEPVMVPVHSCRASQKLLHYRAEHYLDRVMEPVTAMGWLIGQGYPQWAVKRAWQFVLENHAHDSLGCTAIDPVYHQVMARYENALSLSKEIVEDALRAIMECDADRHIPSVWFFNTSSFAWSGTVEAEFTVTEGMIDEEFDLVTEAGETVEYTLLSRQSVVDLRYNPRRGHPTRCSGTYLKLLICLPSVEAFGFLRLRMRKKPCVPFFHMPRIPCFSDQNGMENEYLRVELHSNGTLSLTDKQTGYTYRSLLTFEDGGEAGDAYVYRPPLTDSVYYSTGDRADICMLYDMPQGAAYEIRQAMVIPATLKENRQERSAEKATVDIATVVKLNAHAKRLDLEIRVKNNADSHRLRVLFPTGFSQATVSRGGQPFDMIEHKIGFEYKTHQTEQPYLTHPMQDACDVSQGEFGLTVAAEGIYEYECTCGRNRALALTLMRATDLLEEKTFAGAREYSIPEAQEHRENLYRVSLIPHGGNWRDVYGEAMLFLNPVKTLINRAREISVLPNYLPSDVTLPDSGAFLKLEATDMMITAVKHADNYDSLIVRVWNYGTSTSEASLRIASLAGRKPRKACEVNLNEKTIKPLAIQNDAVRFSLRASGLYTVEIFFS